LERAKLAAKGDQVARDLNELREYVYQHMILRV